MIPADAKTRERFNTTSGYVARRRIDHRIVIGEWNLSQELLVAVSIERCESTVLVLHGQDPCESAVHCLAFPAFAAAVAEAYLGERGQHLKCVVHVRVVFIGIFEVRS